MKIRFLLIVPVLLTTCAPSFFPVVDTVNLKVDRPYIVPAWRILGPIGPKFFGPEQKNKTVFETPHGPKELYSRPYKTTLKKSARPARLINKNVSVATDHLQLFDYFPKADPDVLLTAYAGCTIKSHQKKRLALLLSSDGGFTVWLNGQQISQSLKNRKMRCYQSFILLDLQTGHNHLFIRLRNNGTYWRFAGHLCDPEMARKLYRIWSISNFMQRSILSPGQTVRLRPGPFKGERGVVDVLDQTGKSVFKRVYTLDDSCRFPAPRAGGLFRCRLCCPGDTLQQYFFIGRPDSFLYNSQRHVASVEGDQRIELNACFSRFKHLLQPEYRDNTPIWQKKIVYLIKRIERILVDCPSAATGTMLKGYLSSVDSSIQHYMLHIPPQISGPANPLPLLIIMPYDAIRNLPFLENIVVADIAMTERWAYAADRKRFAVVWPNCRGNSEGAPIEYSDIFQVIKDVKKHYTIDADRIYVLGVCKGAVRALLLAERFPSVFAGLALFAPRITHEQNPWGLARPLDYLQNLKHIPIYICHSKDDEVVPVKETQIFLKYARQYGLNVYAYIPDKITHFGYPDQLLLDVLDVLTPSRAAPCSLSYVTNQPAYNTVYWLSILRMHGTAQISTHVRKDTLNINSKNVQALSLRLHKIPCPAGHIRWNGVTVDRSCDTTIVLGSGSGDTSLAVPAVQGPLFHAFARKFYVVYGTIGTECEGEILFEAAYNFQRHWRRLFFADCRVLSDTDLSMEKMAHANLVLVGDRRTNAVIARLGSRIPVETGREGIRVCNRFFSGPRLGCLAAFANPEYPRNYIVLWSATDTADMQVFDPHPGVYGIYDFGIWKVRHGRRPFPVGTYRFNRQERMECFRP